MVKWKLWQRVRDRRLVPCVLLLRTYVGAPGALEKDFVSWGVCLEDMESAMELRHLRYFIAVAEAGSLTVAAEQKLHTAQPSLSRQIRDLEQEVGVQLIKRSAHGIELTSAGKAFSTVHELRSSKQMQQKTQRCAQPSWRNPH